MIILVTFPSDLNFERKFIVRELELKRLDYICVYPNEFPEHIALSVTPTKLDDRFKLIIRDQTVSSEDVTGIWYYRPPSVSVDSNLDAKYHEVVFQNTSTTFMGNWYQLKDKNWINLPYAALEAAHRGHHLRVAVDLGIPIPKTIISNNFADIDSFFKNMDNQAIYKSLTPYTVYDEQQQPTHSTFVSVINRFELEAQRESIELLPCLFQEIIPAIYDVTVFVIGNKVFAIKNDVRQHHKVNEVDFRLTDHKLNHYAPFELPASLANKLIELTQALQLSMCNFDMVYSDNDGYVLLDVNPTEKWAHLEELTNYPIASTITEYLFEQIK